MHFQYGEQIKSFTKVQRRRCNVFLFVAHQTRRHLRPRASKQLFVVIPSSSKNFVQNATTSFSSPKDAYNSRTRMSADAPGSPLRFARPLAAAQ
jgi:hypothetical protein